MSDNLIKVIKRFNERITSLEENQSEILEILRLFKEQSSQSQEQNNGN